MRGCLQSSNGEKKNVRGRKFLWQAFSHKIYTNILALTHPVRRKDKNSNTHLPKEVGPLLWENLLLLFFSYPKRSENFREVQDEIIFLLGAFLLQSQAFALPRSNQSGKLLSSPWLGVVCSCSLSLSQKALTLFYCVFDCKTIT